MAIVRIVPFLVLALVISLLQLQCSGLFSSLLQRPLGCIKSTFNHPMGGGGVFHIHTGCLGPRVHQCGPTLVCVGVCRTPPGYSCWNVCLLLQFSCSVKVVGSSMLRHLKWRNVGITWTLNRRRKRANKAGWRTEETHTHPRWSIHFS